MITIEKRGSYNRTKTIQIEEKDNDIIISMDGSYGEYSSPSITLKEIQDLVEKYKNKVVVLREDDLDYPFVAPNSVEDLDKKLDEICLRAGYFFTFKIPNVLTQEQFTNMENIFTSSVKYDIYAGDSALLRSFALKRED